MPLLRAVLLADLVDSTAFVQRYGDARAAVALRRLDLQIRDLLEFTGGRLIDKADGLLAIFERPIQAVDFALRYQQALRQFSASEGTLLTARVGIHVGEVMTWSNSADAIAAGAKPLEVEGLAKPVAARLMSLALPGQILVSSMAQSLAQRAESELGERAERVRWIVHGRYRFKGVPAPLLVHEVGEVGHAPLRIPPSGQKVWREVPIWRRPPVLAMELLLFLAVGAFYAYSLLQSPPALAFNERDWVVVGGLSNFTGDPRLEQSLNTALRIGLEQSRYVNVVPDLKVQAVLQRMGRPSQAIVDRAVGSEIALREGARALLLPSIAEIGGRLRVSVEVIDPNTQVTVFSQSAEGRGAESALASLDTVNGELRQSLGESMGELSAHRKPLSRVTTSNLDALRAYSLAQEAFSSGRYNDAVSLYDEAIRLDGQFAMAYAGLARAKLSFGDDAAYYALLAKADSLRSRLTQREALMLDGRIAMHDAPRYGLAKWRLLTDMYPDEYSGYYNYALASWHNGYHRNRALEQLAPATSDKNPGRASALYLQGVLQLGLDRRADALASFQKFEVWGKHGYIRQFAETYAAQRQFQKAAQILAKQSSTGAAYADFSARADSSMFLLDQGKWQAGMSAMRERGQEAAQLSPDRARTGAAVLLSLRRVAPDPELLPDLRGFVASQARWLDSTDPLLRRHDKFLRLVAGLMATELGDPGTGRVALQSVAGKAAEPGFPVLESAAAMLGSALATDRGHPEQAIARLEPMHDGTELYYSHAVLMRAYAAAKRFDDALREAEWLAGRRGFAYGEYSSDYALSALNIVQSNLALLSAAEYALRAGRPEVARKNLAAFQLAWPGARKLDFLTARLDKLAAALAPLTPRNTRTGRGSSGGR